jgi:hypothetical protein
LTLADEAFADIFMAKVAVFIHLIGPATEKLLPVLFNQTVSHDEAHF